MPKPTIANKALTDAQREAYEAVQKHGTIRAAARALGKNYTPVHYCYNAAKRKLELDPAIHDSMTAVGTGLVPALAWAKTKSEDGTSYSVLLKPPQEAESDYIDRLAEAFSDIPVAPPIIQSEHSQEGKIAFFPQSDVHMGVEITADRGGVDYSPDIALERMKDGFAQTHAAIPPCETAIILDNGDLTHANDDKDATPRSDHRLKVTNSHRKNLALSATAKAWQIDMALQRSARVIYRSNRGNHDPNTPDAVGLALQHRYHNEPRVVIDQTERDTWIYQRGAIFLSAHHGHGIKPEKLAANIPPNFPLEFGASRFWYLFTGHLHNPRQDTFGAFQWFQLPAICAMDQHSADMGYTDTAAMRAMMFCERGGLKQDMTVRF